MSLQSESSSTSFLYVCERQGSDEAAHFHRLVRAMAACQYDEYQNMY